MRHWEVRLLDSPKWNGRQWEYSGVPSVSNVVQFGDSPIRDKKSRLEFIAELCEAGANFEVVRYD